MSQVISDTVRLYTGLGPVEATLGVLSDMSRFALVAGQCAGFAVEVNRVTGWQIVGAFGQWCWVNQDELNRNLRNRQDPGFTHALIRHPSGVLFDGRGTYPDDSYTAQYPEGSLELFDLSPDDTQWLADVHCMTEPADVLATFVEPRLMELRSQLPS